MPVVLYTNLEWETVMNFTPLTRNKDESSFSCHCTTPVRCQVATTTEDKPAISDILHDKRSGKRGVQLIIPSKSQYDWWQEVGNQAIVHVTQHCEAWFNKKIELRQVQKMYKSILQTNKKGSYVTLRMSPNVRFFLYSESGAVSPGTVDDLQIGGVVIPIVTLKGLFVNPLKFGSVVEVTDFLVFPHLTYGSESPEERPCEFLQHRGKEDLYDVDFDGDNGPEALTDDDHSYDTKVFTTAATESRRHGRQVE